MTDLSKLKPRLEGHAELVVGEEHTAPRIGSGRVRVLATCENARVVLGAALSARDACLAEPLALTTVL